MSDTMIRRRFARYGEVPADDDELRLSTEKYLRQQVLDKVESSGWLRAGDLQVTEKSHHEDFFMQNRRIMLVELEVLMTPLQAVDEDIEQAKDHRRQANSVREFIWRSGFLAMLLFKRDRIRAGETL